LIVKVFDNKTSVGVAAAEQACDILRRAIRDRTRARMVVATGTSQLEFLYALTRATGNHWQRVEMFHLDEYVGLPISHPASFRKYLRERFIDKTGVAQEHFLDGNDDLQKVLCQVGEALSSAPINVAFVGIGENGRLAFSDLPADFQAEAPYLVVNLDEACRRQQVGEGWFVDIAEVPRQAISMSVRQILKANEIICVVPDARRAMAVRICIEGEISPMAPASILRTHPTTTVYLDKESASLLSSATLSAFAAGG
jgi:glucosamine-6-phosphate deaminase